MPPPKSVDVVWQLYTEQGLVQTCKLILEAHAPVAPAAAVSAEHIAMHKSISQFPARLAMALGAELLLRHNARCCILQPMELSCSNPNHCDAAATIGGFCGGAGRGWPWGGGAPCCGAGLGACPCKGG